MIYLQRKIRVQYCGDEQYRPEQMPADKFLPVIGWKTEKRTVNQKGENIVVDQEFFIVVGNNGIPLKVVAFNCKVIIDDKAEIDMVTLAQLLRNITMIGKTLCEKITGIHTPEDAGKVQKEP